VIIIYANIKKDDCPPIGQPLYSHFWITQYEGCTPLISAEGHLAKTGFSSWSIAYYPDGDASKPAIDEPLLFDDSSLCSKGGEKISCDAFRDGQKASIKGTRSGDAIAVLKLDL
jgi:hypothetical protein